MPDLKFLAEGESLSPTKLRVKVRDFEVIVDEPPSLGGTDDGPNPVEYILVALAGCLNVVGHMVAKEMGFKIHSMKIEVSGNLNPAKFMGKNGDRAGYKKINVRFKLETDADKETLKKWLGQVEERCPVSDNLVNPTPVEIGFEKC
ncbi:osmotically inducible protein C [Thermococcus sp. P6]|uniref:OsmC family protein n=1 Tax=Thermococcus sp. P6 TaxID=122420 RepID=UPI000B59C0C3|nr:OsmC family protein [Thermococcus sp. P6]ASJ10281.1 osmotically inducible protein C [Thermococcus sp. P6]